MNQLEQARQSIDEIDREMARLFEMRMEAVRRVIAYKQDNDMPILDHRREAAVVEKNLSWIENPGYKPYYTDFITHTMQLSRRFQAQMLGKNRIAYSGSEDSPVYLAMKSLFPHGNAMPFPSWEDAAACVERGEAGACFVPFEDSREASFASLLDLCFHHQLHIRKLYEVPVVNSLLALPGTNLWEIREVYGDPQALRLSDTFLRTMDLPAHPLPSAAQAAQFVAASRDPARAAIGSPEMAALYGLAELAKNIHTGQGPVARFAILTQEPGTAGDHFSLLFTVDHQPGQLASVIQEIGRWGFNMETIQSHPRPGMPYSYYFYAELAGTPQQAQTLAAALEAVCQTVRVLGVYRR